MKKLILLSVFIYTVGIVPAQTFELQGGASFSTVMPNTLNLDYEEKYSMNIGFNAGLSITFPISKIFSLETGLLWDTKGFVQTGYQLLRFPGENLFSIYDVTITSRIFYLDIPVLLRESYILNDRSFIFTEFGGYVGVGMLGKLNFEFTNVATGSFSDRENDINWGNNAEGEIKRLDYGLSFGLGYQLYAVQIALAYDLGLANILADINTDRTIKNRTFRASLVYVLNGNSKRKYLKQNKMDP
jgi:hypothetical protein